MPAFPLLALLLSASAPVLAPGQYSLVVEVVGQRSVPLLGELEMRTRTTTFVDLVRDGDELVATERVCAITSEGVAPWGVLFDGGAAPGSIAALGRSTWRMPARSDRLRIDFGARPLGYTGGALPTREDDPRVLDGDGNGRPGALMHMDVKGIGRLSIDVVGFWAATVDGKVVAPDLARGRVTVRSEERIFSGLPMRAQLGPMRIDARRSTFTLARLPARAADGCAISDATATGPRAASRPTSPRR